METKFQTSFIPKKPLVVDQKVHTKKSTSVLMMVATLAFILSLAGAVFTVVFKNILLSTQESYRVQLAESEKRFNATLIEELKKANTKIDLSRTLLKNHIAASELFNIISRLTIEGVRFSSFDFSSPTKENDAIKISMRGTGESFSAIAFQSSVFGESEKYGSNKILKNPVLSDLVLDQNGHVQFTFTTTLNPQDVTYEKVLKATLEAEGSIAPTSDNTEVQQ